MNVARRLLPYVQAYRLRFAQACLAMVVVALTHGAVIYLLKPLIDQAFISRDFGWLWLAILGVPALFGVKTVASYVQNYLMSWIGQSATQALREDLFIRLHALPLGHTSEKRSAEILSRVTNDLGNVQSALQTLPLYLIRDSLTVVALMGVLFSLNVRFALIGLSAIPVALVALFVLGRKMRDASMQSQILMGRIYHRFQESLQGMLLIKAFNYEGGAAEKFRAENLSLFNQTMRYLRAAALSGPLMELSGALVAAVLLYYGGREIISGRMTTGDFFAFLAAFFTAYAPAKNLAKLNSELQRALASGERIFQLLDDGSVEARPAGAVPFTGLKEGLRLENVVFRYPGREEPALRGVTLSVRRGERVAVVGPSGSGKSTLLYLLLRLYEPAEGRVLLDGRDLREFDVRTVRERMGLVTQETVLFNESVRQNVALGRPDAELDEVARACRSADAERFVLALPQGFDTPLGERGMVLSGGQRQRLAIARAALKDPCLLLLDEATSSLDAAGEREVQAALERLMEGRTTVLVAHRLASARSADRIVVLKDGEIVESGTHRELLSANGLYRHLHEIQRAASPALAPAP